MAKIRMLIPQYIKKFNCIGSECEDTCCKNWAITVDKTSYQRYKRLKKDEFSTLLNKNIKLNRQKKESNSHAIIKLQEDGYCPFLTEDKLCGVYGNLSYDYMPATCKLYPRVINRIDDEAEMSLMLSCPEAARKALLSNEIMEFEYVEFELEDHFRYTARFLYTKGSNLKAEEQKYFWEIRSNAIDILQNRRFTIVKRLMLLGMMYKRIQSCIDIKDYEAIPVQIDEFMKLIEVVNPRELFEDMEQNKAIQLFISKVIISEHLLGKNAFPKEMLDLFRGASEAIETLDDNTFLDVVSVAKYKKYLEIGINPYIEKNSHMIEHYLVNLYFSQCMPFVKGSENIWETLIYLCMQYMMIKILMVGRLYHQKQITVDDMIKVIYLVGRNLEHSDSYRKIIVKISEALQLDSLGGLYILIHD